MRVEGEGDDEATMADSEEGARRRRGLATVKRARERAVRGEEFDVEKEIGSFDSRSRREEEAKRRGGEEEQEERRSREDGRSRSSGEATIPSWTYKAGERGEGGLCTGAHEAEERGTLHARVLWDTGGFLCIRVGWGSTETS